MKRHILAIAALSGIVACNSEITGLEPPSDPAAETFAPSLGVNISEMSRTASGVYFKDVLTGADPQIGAETDSIRVTYQGFLKDGRLFDSGTNVPFILANLIKGFQDGLIGLKEGGKRKLVIPSELAYGARSVPAKDANHAKIPRQSTLVFDVEALKVSNPATP